MTENTDVKNMTDISPKPSVKFERRVREVQQFIRAYYEDLERSFSKVFVAEQELDEPIRDNCEMSYDCTFKASQDTAPARERRLPPAASPKRQSHVSYSADLFYEPRSSATLRAPRRPINVSDSSATLEDMLGNMDKGFSDTLFYYIDKVGLSDVDAYKCSNVDKKTFSKIKCNPEYRPSKITAVSFAIGLHLSFEETQHLLSTAGMCLSRSSEFDVIIEYFIRSGNYETIFDVNEVLYRLDKRLLGV